jgi:hypothetical protein
MAVTRAKRYPTCRKPNSYNDKPDQLNQISHHVSSHVDHIEEHLEELITKSDDPVLIYEKLSNAFNKLLSNAFRGRRNNVRR